MGVDIITVLVVLSLLKRAFGLFCVLLICTAKTWCGKDSVEISVIVVRLEYCEASKQPQLLILSLD